MVLIEQALCQLLYKAIKEKQNNRFLLNTCGNVNNCELCEFEICMKCLDNRVIPSCDCAIGFVEQNGSCIRCPDNCQTCSSAQICTQCNQQYELKNNQCSCKTALVGQFCSDPSNLTYTAFVGADQRSIEIVFSDIIRVNTPEEWQFNTYEGNCSVLDDQTISYYSSNQPPQSLYFSCYIKKNRQNVFVIMFTTFQVSGDFKIPTFKAQNIYCYRNKSNLVVQTVTSNQSLVLNQLNFIAKQCYFDNSLLNSQSNINTQVLIRNQGNVLSAIINVINQSGVSSVDYTFNLQQGLILNTSNLQTGNYVEFLVSCTNFFSQVTKDSVKIVIDNSQSSITITQQQVLQNSYSLNQQINTAFILSKPIQINNLQTQISSLPPIFQEYTLQITDNNLSINIPPNTYTKESFVQLKIKAFSGDNSIISQKYYFFTYLSSFNLQITQTQVTTYPLQNFNFYAQITDNDLAATDQSQYQVSWYCLDQYKIPCQYQGQTPQILNSGLQMKIENVFLPLNQIWIIYAQAYRINDYLSLQEFSIVVRAAQAQLTFQSTITQTNNVNLITYQECFSVKMIYTINVPYKSSKFFYRITLTDAQALSKSIDSTQDNVQICIQDYFPTLQFSLSNPTVVTLYFFAYEYYQSYEQRINAPQFYQVQIRKQPFGCQFNIGNANQIVGFRDQVTVNVANCQIDFSNAPFTYQYFIYQNAQQIQTEILDPSVINRQQISFKSTQPQLTTVFPPGSIIVMVILEGQFQVKANFTQSIYVLENNYSSQDYEAFLQSIYDLAQNVKSQSNKEQEILNYQTISKAILSFESKNVDYTPSESIYTMKNNIIQRLLEDYWSSSQSGEEIYQLSLQIISQIQQSKIKLSDYEPFLQQIYNQAVLNKQNSNYQSELLNYQTISKAIYNFENNNPEYSPSEGIFTLKSNTINRLIEKDWMQQSLEQIYPLLLQILSQMYQSKLKVSDYEPTLQLLYDNALNFKQASKQSLEILIYQTISNGILYLEQKNSDYSPTETLYNLKNYIMQRLLEDYWSSLQLGEQTYRLSLQILSSIQQSKLRQNDYELTLQLMYTQTQKFKQSSNKQLEILNYQYISIAIQYFESKNTQYTPSDSINTLKNNIITRLLDQYWSQSQSGDVIYKLSQQIISQIQQSKIQTSNSLSENLKTLNEQAINNILDEIQNADLSNLSESQRTYYKEILSTTVQNLMSNLNSINNFTAENSQYAIQQATKASQGISKVMVINEPQKVIKTVISTLQVEKLDSQKFMSEYYGSARLLDSSNDSSNYYYRVNVQTYPTESPIYRDELTKINQQYLQVAESQDIQNLLKKTYPIKVIDIEKDQKSLRGRFLDTLESNLMINFGQISESEKLKCIQRQKDGVWASNKCKAVVKVIDDQRQIVCYCTSPDITSILADIEQLFNNENVQDLFNGEGIKRLISLDNWYEYASIWTIVFLNILLVILLIIGYKLDQRDKKNYLKKNFLRKKFNQVDQNRNSTDVLNPNVFMQIKNSPKTSSQSNTPKNNQMKTFDLDLRNDKVIQKKSQFASSKIAFNKQSVNHDDDEKVEKKNSEVHNIFQTEEQQIGTQNTPFSHNPFNSQVRKLSWDQIMNTDSPQQNVYLERNEQEQFILNKNDQTNSNHDKFDHQNALTKETETGNLKSNHSIQDKESQDAQSQKFDHHENGSTSPTNKKQHEVLLVESIKLDEANEEKNSIKDTNQLNHTETNQEGIKKSEATEQKITTELLTETDQIVEEKLQQKTKKPLGMFKTIQNENQTNKKSLGIFMTIQNDKQEKDLQTNQDQNQNSSDTNGKKKIDKTMIQTKTMKEQKEIQEKLKLVKAKEKLQAYLENEKIFKGILVFHIFFSSFIIYNEKFSRCTRFIIYYNKMIWLLTLNSIFGVNLNAVQIIVLSIVSTIFLLVVTTAITILFQKKKHKKFGVIIIFLLFVFCYYSILVVISGQEPYDSNMWISSYFLTLFINEYIIGLLISFVLYYTTKKTVNKIENPVVLQILGAELLLQALKT